jgi:hypothetical protein
MTFADQKKYISNFLPMSSTNEANISTTRSKHKRYRRRIIISIDPRYAAGVGEQFPI